MVVSNVILSSLFCKRDKYNWAFHLFKIYQQYEDSLCRKALSKLRNSKIVSVEKDKKSRKIDDHAPPPLSANPYQLSVTFMHKFLTRFQSDLFGNVNRFVDLIKFQDLVEVPFGSDGGGKPLILVYIMNEIWYIRARREAREAGRETPRPHQRMRLELPLILKKN